MDDPGRTDPNFAVVGVTRKMNHVTELYAETDQGTLKYSPNAGATAPPPLVCVSYLNDNAHGNYVP